MNKIYFFLAIILLASCGQQESNEISFYNGVTFRLNEGDSILKKSQAVIDDFQNSFKRPPYKMPLFKSIKTHNSLIFFALPVNMNLQEVFNSKVLKVDSEPILSFSDSTKVFYRCFIQEESTFLEFGEVFEGNFIYAVQISNEKVKSPESHIQDFKSRFNR